MRRDSQWSKYYDLPAVAADVYITEEGSIILDIAKDNICCSILIKEDGSITFVQDGVISKDRLRPDLFGRLRDVIGHAQETYNG